jgi:hypothetical protein
VHAYQTISNCLTGDYRTGQVFYIDSTIQHPHPVRKFPVVEDLNSFEVSAFDVDKDATTFKTPNGLID